MKRHTLNQEEKALLNSYETENWDTIDDFVAKARAYTAYARNTFIKDHTIRIRVTAPDRASRSRQEK